MIRARQAAAYAAHLASPTTEVVPAKPKPRRVMRTAPAEKTTLTRAEWDKRETITALLECGKYEARPYPGKADASAVTLGNAPPLTTAVTLGDAEGQAAPVTLGNAASSLNVVTLGDADVDEEWPDGVRTDFRDRASLYDMLRLRGLRSPRASWSKYVRRWPDFATLVVDVQLPQKSQATPMVTHSAWATIAARLDGGDEEQDGVTLGDAGPHLPPLMVSTDEMAIMMAEMEALREERDELRDFVDHLDNTAWRQREEDGAEWWCAK